MTRTLGRRLYDGIGLFLLGGMMALALSAMPYVTDTGPSAMWHIYGTVVLAHGAAVFWPRRRRWALFALGAGAAAMIVWWALFWWPESGRWAFWLDVAKEIRQGSTALYGGELPRMSPALRTMMFDLGLFGFVVGLVGPAVRRRQVFGMVVLYVSVLAIWDTFWAYDGRGAIVWAAASALLLFGWTAFGRLLEHLDGPRAMRGKAALWVPWATVLVLATAGAVAAGRLAPETEPAWPDPVPFLPSMKERALSAFAGATLPGAPTIGRYGGDDHHLGGPFVGSDTVLFTVRHLDGGTPPPHYFRLMSSDRYTGSSWQSNPEWTTVYPAPDPEEEVKGSRAYELDRYAFLKRGMGNAVRVVLEEVRPAQPTETAVYGGEPQKLWIPDEALAAEGGRDASTVLIDGESGALRLPKTVRYVYRTALDAAVSERQIADAYASAVETVGSTDWSRLYPNELDTLTYGRYTQLPARLPERVITLARELTETATTPYEAARKIEQYLARGDVFRYATRDVPYVAAGEDFVDQFLFELKKGYCDHFSSSMVVMLRSLGIPARWVKGFGPGETVRDPSGDWVTVVRAKDAHAWVEAYMPGVGWVPFEPTPRAAPAVAARERVNFEPSNGETARNGQGEDDLARLRDPAQAERLSPSLQDGPSSAAGRAEAARDNASAADRRGGGRPTMLDARNVGAWGAVRARIDGRLPTWAIGAGWAAAVLVVSLLTGGVWYFRRLRSQARRALADRAARKVRRLLRRMSGRRVAWADSAAVSEARLRVVASAIDTPLLAERWVALIRHYERLRYAPLSDGEARAEYARFSAAAQAVQAALSDRENGLRV